MYRDYSDAWSTDGRAHCSRARDECLQHYHGIKDPGPRGEENHTAAKTKAD